MPWPPGGRPVPSELMLVTVVEGKPAEIGPAVAAREREHVWVTGHPRRCKQRTGEVRKRRAAVGGWVKRHRLVGHAGGVLRAPLAVQPDHRVTAAVRGQSGTWRPGQFYAPSRAVAAESASANASACVTPSAPSAASLIRRVRSSV